MAVPRAAVLKVVSMLASVVMFAPTAATADRGDPPFTEPVSDLAAAVQCDAGAESGTLPTVLLVHGTGATAREAWGWNYQIVLPKEGFGVCVVDLPDRALGDMARSAEYVAYAAQHAHQVSDRPITILGHSQGGLLAVWVALFWPSVAASTDDVISLAGPMNGTALADTLCVTGSCAPIAWQLRQGSAFVEAANAAPRPQGVSFTSIGSRLDEVVFPQPRASTLNGGRTIMIQDVCPLAVSEHGLLLVDAAAHTLVLDAINHDGPADPERIGAQACLSLAMPGVNPLGALDFARTLVNLTLGLINTAEWVSTEPGLPAYAVPRPQTDGGDDPGMPPNGPDTATGPGTDPVDGTGGLVPSTQPVSSPVSLVEGGGPGPGDLASLPETGAPVPLGVVRLATGLVGFGMIVLAFSAARRRTTGGRGGSTKVT